MFDKILQYHINFRSLLSYKDKATTKNCKKIIGGGKKLASCCLEHPMAAGLSSRGGVRNFPTAAEFSFKEANIRFSGYYHAKNLRKIVFHLPTRG